MNRMAVILTVLVWASALAVFIYFRRQVVRPHLQPERSSKKPTRNPAEKSDSDSPVGLGRTHRN
jgi:hypothetical protein